MQENQIASKSRAGLLNEYCKLHFCNSNIIKILGRCRDVWSLCTLPNRPCTSIAFWSFRKRKHYLSCSSEIKLSPLSCLHLTFRREGEEERRWENERESVLEKKHRRRLRWTKISVNAKSAGFILKQFYIFLVICAAHFIMLVLDKSRWECRAALD